MHPDCRAFRASCPPGSLADSGVRRQHLRVLTANARASCARPLRGLICVREPRQTGAPEAAHIPCAQKRGQERGTSKSTSKSTSKAEGKSRERKVQSNCSSVHRSCFCAHGMCAAPGSRPGAASARRRSRVSDRAHDAREFAASTWMCCLRTPQCARAVGGQDARRPRPVGVLSFWLLFLCTSKEKVTRSSAGGVEALLSRTGKRKTLIPA